MKKFSIKFLFFCIVGVGFLPVFAYYFTVNYDQKVSDFSSKYIYSDIQKVPVNKCGLLLGTSKYLKSGIENLFYNYRVNAAYALYTAKKIDCLVVSGDNSIEKYNEPESMKADLIKKGYPEQKLYLDYAGFDTLDSVVRMKEIFGQESFTIISQKFHNERAVYIAKNKGYDVVAFNAKDVNNVFAKRVLVREKLSRIKMLFELLVNKGPKFLGEKIIIK